MCSYFARSRQTKTAPLRQMQGSRYKLNSGGHRKGELIARLRHKGALRAICLNSNPLRPGFFRLGDKEGENAIVIVRFHRIGVHQMRQGQAAAVGSITALPQVIPQKLT